MKLRYFLLLATLLTMGCGSSDSTDVNAQLAASNFQHDGVNLQVATIVPGTIAEVRDAQGELLLTFEITDEKIIYHYAEFGEMVLDRLIPPGGEELSDSALHRMAAYPVLAMQEVREDDAKVSMRTICDAGGNRPGCDLFPDTKCTQNCCALHDDCYKKHSCSACSWLPAPLGGPSIQCKKCNALAVSCIAFTCSKLRPPNRGDECYDSKCGEFFACASPNCGDCESPCKNLCK